MLNCPTVLPLAGDSSVSGKSTERHFRLEKIEQKKLNLELCLVQFQIQKAIQFFFNFNFLSCFPSNLRSRVSCVVLMQQLCIALPGIAGLSAPTSAPYRRFGRLRPSWPPCQT